MKEPRRLLEGDGTQLEIALLRSAAEDVPGPRARRRALAALGLGGGVAVATTTTATGVAAKMAGEGAAAAGLATAGTAAKASLAGVLVKWIGIASIGSIATWGIVDQVTSPAPAPAPINGKVTAVTKRAVAARRAAALRPVPAKSHLAIRPTTDPAADAPDRLPEPAPPPSAGHAKPQPSLADEVAAIDRAKAAIDKKDPEAALKAVAEYEQQFKDGMLAPEAQVVRIEALASRGDRAQAQALASAFLAQHPDSPYGQRVRTVLSKTE